MNSYTSPNICPVCKEYRDDLDRCRCTSGYVEQFRRNYLNFNVVIVSVILGVGLLSACGGVTAPYHVRKGTMRDTIYAIERRGNGTVVIWPTNSETEGYCFPRPGIIDNVDNLLMNHNGEVVIEYEGQGNGVVSAADPQQLCRYAELSSTYTIHIGLSLKPVVSR